MGEVPMEAAKVAVRAAACCVALLASEAVMARSIENEHVRVVYDPKASTFSVHRAGGACFVRGAAVPGAAGAANAVKLRSRRWGAGRGLAIPCADGSTARLTVYDKLPFLTVQVELANTGSEARVVDRLPLVRLTASAGAKAEDLRAFGTFGLKGIGASNNPGSYAHLAVADPNTRAGTVLAFLTHERGSGVFTFQRADGGAVVEARLDYGRLRIEPGKTASSETLLIGGFQDARLGLEAYADAVARHYDIHLPPQPTVYCSWYHARASDTKRLAANAAFAEEHLKPFGFSVVQIDDGWQSGVSKNGPRKNFTTHNPKGPYPDGMKATADRVRSLGLVPGIWFMPFSGTADDPFFADKQHLFATKDGKPYEVRWGGTCFDLTNPKTVEYVRTVAERICGQWGYGYIKIDGLWTGSATKLCYVNTSYKEDRIGESRLHDPAVTHIEAYRRGLRAVREGAGTETFILGCNVAQNMRTLGGSFGLLDAMRVGPDNGPRWGSMVRGPFSGGNLYFLHGRVWYNDPDPVYVRPSVPIEQARALVSWVALTGQLNASSYDYAKLPADRLDLLKRSMPAHRLRARPVDLFEQNTPRVWLLTDDRATPRRDVLGLFNWYPKKPVRFAETPERIGLPKADAYVGFDYWRDEFVGPVRGTLEMPVPAASCRILSLRPASDRPQVVGTSRHITQGILDLTGERWDAAARTLHGTSRLVGGDRYEVRIAVPAGESPWRAERIRVSAAGVTGSVRQEGPHVRATLRSDADATVPWRVVFRRGSGR